MKRRSIIVIGQLPPPLMGLSFITAQMVDLLREDHDVHVYNIAARPDARGLIKHVSRLVRTGLACLGMLRHARTKNGACYIACEGDLGLIYTIAVSLVARMIGRKRYLHHHSFGYIDRRKTLMRLLLLLSGQLTHVFLSPAMRARFEETYGRVASCQILSNAAFISPVGPIQAAHRTAATLVIGHLGQLSREKGLYLFLDLLRAMIATGLDVRGVLAGPARLSIDRAAIDAAVTALAPRLDYRGPVYGVDKAQFYADIDVFVLPTLYPNEAQPAVLFEASAAGCQILAYDRGCIAEHADYGLVVPKDTSLVASGRAWLTSVAASLSERERLRQSVRDRYGEMRSAHVRMARSLFSM